MSVTRAHPHAVAVLGALLVGACGSGEGDGGASGRRRTTIVDVLTAADADILRDRPRLAAGKYALMATNAFAFFRGSLALYLHDWRDPSRGLAATRFPANGAQPFGLGDAHPENFGTLRTRAGIFRLEPNDFDTADLVPYLWDVRRFAVGMCLAARLSNPTDQAARSATAASARAVARAASASYADTLRDLAAGGGPPVVAGGGGNAVLDDLFSRSQAAWDSRADLDALTKGDDFPRLVRGELDPADPEDVTRDLPALARSEISASLAGYRASLLDPPSVAELLPLDAVQQFGQGVGSFPRLRALALVRGASTEKDDDAVLEIKELAPRESLPLPVPSAFSTPADRLLAALRSGWTERGADPLWGVGSWGGFPVQIRNVSAGHRTVRVSQLEGDLGTPGAVTGLGVSLARLIARMHAAPVPGGQSLAAVIAQDIAADPEGFADEQADAAVAYCDQVQSDWLLFQQALARLGPTLGVAGNPAAVSTPDLRVLFDPQMDPRAAGIDRIADPIAINEIAATGVVDFVELVNVSLTEQPLGEYRLADSDSDGGPRMAAATSLGGVTLRPGGRVVVVGGYTTATAGPQTDCTGGIPYCFQATWGIGASNGETMYLLSAADVIVDQVTYPGKVIPAGQSWSRVPDALGAFVAAVPTPAAANVAP